MIVSLRRFSFALPRRAWRVVKARKARTAVPKVERLSLVESFERTLASQVNLVLRDLSDH